MNISENRNTEAVNHSYGHEVAIIVDNFSEAEDASPVEGERDDNGSVPTLNGVAVVHESLVAKRGDWKALLLKARKNPGDKELEEEIARVHLPRVKVGTCILRKAVGTRCDSSTHYSPFSHGPTF